MNNFSESRRNLLLSSTLVGLGVGSAVAADMEHHHHHHHTDVIDAKHKKLLESAMHCIMNGQLCIQHCTELFKQGDTSIAACNDAALEMIASCTAMSQFVSYKSQFLKDLLPVCLTVCENCEKECRKHAEEHAACRACANSCVDCIKTIKAYLA